MHFSRPFRFQRFTIRQTRAAMKVGFDGVLLGAWAELAGEGVLDIGTGTGLLSLMAAQRTADSRHPVVIDAIEIDGNAVLDAEDNFEASPWSDRLRLHHASIQEWASERTAEYHSLLCNPPFFTANATATGSRPTARHDGQLTLRELVDCSRRLLTEEGCLSLIVPVARLEELDSLVGQSGMHRRRITFVRPLPDKPPHRVLVAVSTVAGSCQRDELTIETTHHHYSPEFRALTRDFYIEDYQP